MGEAKQEEERDGERAEERGIKKACGKARAFTFLVFMEDKLVFVQLCDGRLHRTSL